VTDVLTRAVAGEPIESTALRPWLAAEGSDLETLRQAADAARQAQVGDTVTYVVNRNINFTNVCVKACRFCAYARGFRSEQSYRLPIEEVVRRAKEAWELGATEVCMQAGLAPELTGQDYIDLCDAVKTALPDLHVHAFSPEEVKFGARKSGWTFEDMLRRLQDVGLNSLPGTSAEILDDAVRTRIAPGRISTAEWLDVVTTAHRLGIPTTSTIMTGHLDSVDDRLRHLDLLRTTQAESGGFTEFVPLSFVHTDAPMWQALRPDDLRAGPTTDDVLRFTAVARLLLGPSIPNLQASWVKEGLDLATTLLDWGANDLGGTLINESISTAAGAGHGQRRSPAELRAAIRSAGRLPAERNTLYKTLRTFDDPAGDPVDGLDALDDADARFGSYAGLAADARFTYARPRRRN
jgi:7,8-didemethyl-8-hydroxy-5-deazariboflavin synthase CofH subunit